MSLDALLSARGLKKYYPVTGGGWLRRILSVKALDGVDLDIFQGETFGLVGESGCGKLTLGRCILRLERPTAGVITFDGRDVLACGKREMRSLRRQMQIVFQDPYSSLDPRQTVGAVIGEPLKVHERLSGAEHRQRLERLMAVVGMLPEHLHRYPHEFSGGQRQRICIARALALNPKLVIADEAVSALDVSIQAQILNLLVTLQRRFHLTYLFISHDLSVVRHLCDRVAVMYLGRIVELAPRTDLYDTPRHPYTEALLSAVPVANPVRRPRRIYLDGDVPSPIHPPSGCPFHPRCPHRQNVCTRRVPVFEELAPGRWVSCHYPLRG